MLYNRLQICIIYQYPCDFIIMFAKEDMCIHSPMSVSLRWSSLSIPPGLEDVVVLQKENLKQHYVTLTVTRGFEKQHLMMQINTSHKKTAILVKQGHI